MTPTQTVRKEEITGNGAPNGRVKAPDAAPNDAVLRELQALRRSEAVLRDFIETSTIGLHWVGADGTILWANSMSGGKSPSFTPTRLSSTISSLA
jgi:hypothetical protein